MPRIKEAHMANTGGHVSIPPIIARCDFVWVPAGVVLGRPHSHFG